MGGAHDVFTSTVNVPAVVENRVAKAAGVGTAHSAAHDGRRSAQSMRNSSGREARAGSPSTMASHPRP